MEAKPKKVKAKITRIVTEIAIVTLDKDGQPMDLIETIDELEYDFTDLHSVQEILSVYS